MYKNTLFFISIFFLLISVNAQNKIEKSQAKTGQYDEELYVSFAKSIQFKDHNYLETLLVSIPEMKAINDEFHLQLKKGITISDEKLDFMESEAIRISKNGKSVRQLRNILKVKIDNPTEERIKALISKLEKLSVVNYCNLVSLEPIQPPGDIAPVTTDYEPSQTYLSANPGVNMTYAWGLGLIGAGIRIRDVEYGFNKNHEDLVDGNGSVAAGMTISSSASTAYTEHGTAVFGVVYADKGSYGVSGMAYGAQEIVLFPEWQEIGYNRIYAISEAIDHSVSGDVIMYEMQTGGSGNNFVPAEYDATVWDLTKAASDAGIIIVAAAGNGNQDLDSAFYIPYMSRGNSGAIIVGAGSPNLAHNKSSFSTYGSRVDVQGWGGSVRTTGYGDFIQVGGDFNQNYTNFSGTSSATPIVASCVIVLQSYYHSLTGNYMNSTQMKNLLISTGIAQGTGGHIGPLPNIQAAINEMNLLTAQEHSELVIFSVFPNPTKDKIIINIQQNVSSTAKVDILNAIGQKVFTSPIGSGNNEISLADFQKGLYFVKVINGEKASVKKIIKQ